MKIKILSILSVTLLAICSAVSGKLSMPSVFGDNMVLQRNTNVAIYGTANPDERVSIQVTWTKETFRTKADKAGKWRVDVPTGDASTGEWVQVKAGNTLEFKNVCLGEVWICSGQSNMARLLSGRAGGPIENGFSIIKSANRPDVRLLKLPEISESLPQADISAQWSVSDHETAAAFSAVGYIFGKELNDYLDVPIGLIQSAWGGSNVETWISKEKFKALGKTETNSYYLEKAADISVRTGPNHMPSALYNGMIHPLIPYTFRGAIWYQGEANVVNSSEYAELLGGMVSDWRERWGVGDFPFYIVQIAPFTYPPDRGNSALVREAQMQVPERIPNAATAVILDLGLENDIHPPFKIPVGQRLATLALANTYGVEGFPKGSPAYDSMQIERSRIRVRFKNAGQGLYIEGSEVNGLEIAGEDRIFYPARGQAANRDELLVSSEKVAAPVAVRYGFTNWVQGNLFSVNGFAVSSFRTDDWDQ
ncbi:MAG: sialate O-acetylesterase [Verrucomicrobia bacterium]|nr:sialate O-acetylesterase [Verrucomicrobiota bacterium]MDA1066479.1 sialate O-acetylesterase [Verrucomicrobiota bacterium]